MKLAILSPTFPPKVCGVGDHTFHLMKALKEAGHFVEVYSEQKDIDSSLEIQTTDSLASKILKFSPDALLFQYTPYLYGGAFNVGSYLWPILKFAKLKKIKIIMLAHELYFPLQLSLPGILIAPLQRWRFNKLFKYADQIVFTNELCWEAYKSNKNANWLPVASNIPIAIGENIALWNKKQGIKENETVILHFGGAHPTHLYDFVLAIPDELKKINLDDVKIICVGITANELENLNENASTATKNILGLGKLAAKEISMWLQRADIVVAPFMDGISARRGSAMAAFEHGKCVVTTTGHSTEKSIPWKEFCEITENNKQEFLTSTTALVQNKEKAQFLGAKAQEYYTQHFHWPVLCEHLVEMISK